MIYHLLPEMEVFSAYRGGAIAKDIANIMRFDSSRIVVCQSADDSWGYGPERILQIPALRAYAKIWARGRIPVWVTGAFFRQAFQPLLSRLNETDIVWCHNQPFFAAALEKAIHAKGAKLVFHSHDGRCAYAVRNAFRSFTPDAYIFISSALKKVWSDIAPWLKNTYIVHNGANENIFYPALRKAGQENNPLIVLYVGQLQPIKGVHVLVEAMKILQEKKVNVFCRAVGSSFSGNSKVTPYMRTLQKRCPSNMQFVGYRAQTEIGNEYRAADILCCPSVWQEPFGNTNIEAMACGIPVVATRVGGIPEIASEGGIVLVEPNSSVQLADALERLAADRELRTKIAAEGLQSFQRRFTWAAAYRRYREITDSLTQIRKSRLA